jgi:tetratricopeptide (TPR) repeat protein
MGWINLNNDADDASSVSNKSFQNVDTKSLLMKGNPNIKTWNIHLKTLLFEKASLTYACLAEDSYNIKNYGAALKNIRQSIACQAVIKKYIPSIITQQSVLYGRAGDCFFQISKSLDQTQKFINGFNDESEFDREILKQLEKENLGEIETEILMPSEDEEKMLECSCHCYENSLLDTNQSQIELIRRLGNVYNEIGVKLMHKSQNSYNAFIAEFNSKSDDEKPSNETTTYQQIAKQSYDFLMKAVALFESVKDHINLVICHLNLGRFYRLSAHINIFQNYQTTKSLKMQKKCYQQSFDSYRKALDILVEKKMKNAELYEIVLWEYSTAVFNLAKEMQEGISADNSRDEAEREVLDMLMKALQLCDIESNNSRQVLYMFRAALIHQRISSLHHQSIRMSCEEHKRKTTLQLCRLHYEKSIKLLEVLKEFKDFLKVQLERIALQEFLAEESSSNQMKIKNYQIALSYFHESLKMLKMLSVKKALNEGEEILSLLELFEKRLQFVLKSLTKLSSNSKKSNEAENYKKMFAVTLRNSQKLKLEELSQHLLKVLDTINKMDSK